MINLYARFCLSGGGDSDSSLANNNPLADILKKRRKNPSTKGTRPPFVILEALAATGLRSLRYAKECNDVDCVIGEIRIEYDMAVHSLLRVPKRYCFSFFTIFLPF